MKMEAIGKLIQFVNEKKQKQTALKTRLEKEYSESMKLKNLIEKSLKMKNYLQNTDEINYLKNIHMSKIQSQDELVGFLNYDFIILSQRRGSRPTLGGVPLFSVYLYLCLSGCYCHPSSVEV
ncbi:hypothetical protein CAEBREN_12526 [Caenorhabditis brenneri]|uniref:Uncharacterized protein n=1 Tax=Caenorhabditis brenneri TaxID=135651 RepID=G0PG16_CAEBE|nr:hypothetical protein CAEBREN_12526 [Caenorhabditis brenneri]